LRLQRERAALVEGLKRVAHALVGTAEGARNVGSRLPRGTGEEPLAATDRHGGRGPAPGLQGSSLVRRERAHTYGCLPIQKYTICQNIAIGSALGDRFMLCVIKI